MPIPRRLLQVAALVCVLILAIAWYRSSHGRRIRNLYKVSKVTWQQPTGTLVLALDHLPSVQSTVLEVLPDPRLMASSSLTAGEAAWAEQGLAAVAGTKVIGLGEAGTTVSVRMDRPALWPARTWSADADMTIRID